MKFKSVSAWWPLALFALSGAAHADLEPYSFGASETVQHQSNVGRTPDASRQADWLSTTELTAGVDQPLGRDRLSASASLDLNRYKNRGDLDANGYNALGQFDWSTIGDLSGSLGGSSRRRQYFYGLDGEIPGSTTTVTTHNLETDNRVFANAQIGGPSRWVLFAGADASQRLFSSSVFDSSEERQWSAHGGTSYSTSPDLSFGLTGSLTRGLYPHFMIGDQRDDFNLKSLSLTSKWQVSGVSALDASVGYTHADYTGQSPSKFVNGALNWTWTPPSHISVALGLSRDSDADTAASGGVAANNNLTGRAINNVGHVLVTYALTAKTSLVANAQYTQRRYSNTVVPTFTDGAVGLNGTNRTWVIGLTAHFQPTRTTDVGCGASREVRTADASIAASTPGYSDNSVQCTAAIKFD
jgi:hypothetical protein